MGTALGFLVDWCIRYLENKDSVRKEIQSVDERKESGFRITYKSGPRQFLVLEEFSSQAIGTVANDASSGLFILNNLSNVSAFIEHWSSFSAKKKLTCYFINPFSATDKAWIINPYVHAMVCDPDSLELGVKTMSEMVEYISTAEFEKRLEGEEQ